MQHRDGISSSSLCSFNMQLAAHSGTGTENETTFLTDWLLHPTPPPSLLTDLDFTIWLLSFFSMARYSSMTWLHSSRIRLCSNSLSRRSFSVTTTCVSCVCVCVCVWRGGGVSCTHVDMCICRDEGVTMCMIRARYQAHVQGTSLLCGMVEHFLPGKVDWG